MKIQNKAVLKPRDYIIVKRLGGKVLEPVARIERTPNVVIVRRWGKAA